MRQMKTVLIHCTVFKAKAKTKNLTEAHKSFCSLLSSSYVGLPTLPPSSPRGCEQTPPLTAAFTKLHILLFPYAAAPDMN